MSEEKDSLLSLLKDLIKDYTKEIDEYNDSLPSIYEENRDSLKTFVRDVSTIVEMDLNTIEELLREEIEDVQEREELISNLKIIQTLLISDKKNHTDYHLSFEQLQYMGTFLKKVLMIMKKYEEESNEKKEQKERLTTICEKYKELLTILTDPNNHKLINDMELIELLLKESNLEDIERRKILIHLMKKNQTTYENILSNKGTFITLNDHEIDKILSKYGYHYDDLNESNQEYLKEYATYEDIKDIIKCWVDYNLPILNLKEEGDIFTHIVIRMKPSLLEEMLKTSIDNHINSIETLEILTVLLVESDNDEILESRIKDYQKNLIFFRNHGYDINAIFKRERKVLWMNHKLLKKNFSLLKDYQLLTDTLTNELLQIIDNERLGELIDSFIEISKNTYPYLKQSPTIINELKENDDLLEIIYYHEHNKELLGAFLEKENRLILRRNIEKDDFISYKPSFLNEITFLKAIDDFTEKEEEVKYQPIEELISYIDRDNPLLYNMSGIMISRLKVERIYEILVESNCLLQDSLIFAVTYHTILTEDDFNKIKKVLGLKEIS